MTMTSGCQAGCLKIPRPSTYGKQKTVQIFDNIQVFRVGRGVRLPLGPLPQPRTNVCFDAAITDWDDVYYTLMTNFLLYHFIFTFVAPHPYSLQRRLV